MPRTFRRIHIGVIVLLSSFVLCSLAVNEDEVVLVSVCMCYKVIPAKLVPCADILFLVLCLCLVS